MKGKFLILLFGLHIFFMFYNLEKWAPFGWDQVDNAWASMKMVTQSEYPLEGMVAKGNSGIHIGPLYYYPVALFYFFTRLDPIAAPILAGVTSLFSFWVIYYVSKNLFTPTIALISLFIYTCSSFIITTERVQWPVNFIAPLSLLILYCLYDILENKPKYFLLLASIIGFSFHIHFTAIFYPIIVLATLPFIHWNKKTIRYFLLSLLIGLIFFIPQIISFNNQAFSSYAQSSYHGLHLRRVLQLAPDAFIKFKSLLPIPYISILFVPLFMIIHKEKIRFLIALWFLVPWLIFATYSGEISDYYFSLQTYIAIIILAYFTTKIPKIIAIVFWGYWLVVNITQFFNFNPGSLPKNRAEALEASKTSRIIPFTEGDPISYLYYYYMYKKGGWLPYNL